MGCFPNYGYSPNNNIIRNLIENNCYGPPVNGYPVDYNPSNIFYGHNGCRHEHRRYNYNPALDDVFTRIDKADSRANNPIPDYNFNETANAALNIFKNKREMVKTLDMNKDGKIDETELNSFAIYADKNFDSNFDGFERNKTRKELSTPEGKQKLRDIYNLNKPRVNLLKTNPYSEKIDKIEDRMKNVLSNGIFNSPEAQEVYKSDGWQFLKEFGRGINQRTYNYDYNHYHRNTEIDRFNPYINPQFGDGFNFDRF